VRELRRRRDWQRRRAWDRDTKERLTRLSQSVIARIQRDDPGWLAEFM
jgi:hypothetical protein